jgi:hypothetical protein
LECDHLFEFLAHLGTVIEAGREAELVAVSPAFDENEVSDLESETQAHGCRATVSASSNPVAIVNAVRTGDLPTTPFLKVIRFEAIERIETPSMFEDSS